jgi:hypothetical protein
MRQCLKSSARFVRLTPSPSGYRKDFLIPHFVAPRIAVLFFVGPLTVLMFSVALAGPVTAEDVQLESDTKVATAGYFQLRWRAGSGVELQESRSADFEAPRIVYAGSDAARVISGKPDGDWYYRAAPAASNGAFGNTVKVTVRHHPIERAIGYFAVGFVVFVATLLLIVSGARSRT